MTLKKFTRVEAFATANAFVFDFGTRHKHRYTCGDSFRGCRIVAASHRFLNFLLLAPCYLRQNTRSNEARWAGALFHFGLWLSLVERLVRDQEAVGSNPTSPINFRHNRVRLSLFSTCACSNLTTKT